jgi:hypothetical protein
VRSRLVWLWVWVCRNSAEKADVPTWPHRFEYLWQDSVNYKRPTKMPAPAYIEQLMSWVQSNIDNEAVLPSRIGEALSFPAWGFSNRISANC